MHLLTAPPGLRNDSGENSCFLNVIVQVSGGVFQFSQPMSVANSSMIQFLDDSNLRTGFLAPDELQNHIRFGEGATGK
jgi:hypothetical protein